MNVSQLIGKQLLSPAGETLGYVLAAYLGASGKRLACLSCADMEEEEFYLPARAVLSYGDALIVGSARIPAPTGFLPPVGLAAYTETGESLGAVCDFVIDTTPMVVTSKSDEAFPYSSVLSTENVIVYRSGKKPARKIQKKEEHTMPGPAPASEPEAVEFDRINLLGRRVRKSVYDGEGNPIILAGERVTPAVISQARRKNRLLALTVNTLTGVY